MPRIDKNHLYDRETYKYSPVSGHVNVCRVYSRYFLWGDTSDKNPYVNARIKEFDGKKIVVWKKALTTDGGFRRNRGRCLVKLEVSARALRYQPNNYKCRSSSARVLGIFDLYGKKLRRKIAFSKYLVGRRCPLLRYKVGETVKPQKKFDKNYTRECASGIHFFLTMKEAADFNW